MNNTTDRISEAMRNHREWRQETGFLLPDPRQCLMYALSEAGEVYDAILRQERTADTRRRSIDADVNEELCDMVAMLVSALVAGDTWALARLTPDDSKDLDVFSPDKLLALAVADIAIGLMSEHLKGDGPSAWTMNTWMWSACNAIQKLELLSAVYDGDGDVDMMVKRFEKKISSRLAIKHVVPV